MAAAMVRGFITDPGSKATIWQELGSQRIEREGRVCGGVDPRRGGAPGEVDLEEVFTYGQAYVMLSRVRNLKGLKILSLDFDKIRASPKALDFYDSLDSRQHIPESKG